MVIPTTAPERPSLSLLAVTPGVGGDDGVVVSSGVVNNLVGGVMTCTIQTNISTNNFIIILILTVTISYCSWRTVTIIPTICVDAYHVRGTWSG